MSKSSRCSTRPSSRTGSSKSDPRDSGQIGPDHSTRDVAVANSSKSVEAFGGKVLLSKIKGQVVSLAAGSGVSLTLMTVRYICILHPCESSPRTTVLQVFPCGNAEHVLMAVRRAPREWVL